MSEPGNGRVALAVVGVAALIPPVIALALVASLDAGRTGARIVTWYGPSGDAIPREAPGALYPFDGCSGDIGLTGLVHDGALWTTCGANDRLDFTALARIDPSAGEGRMRWPFPPELPLNSTVAIVPRSDGALGIVYRSGDVQGPVAVAVAGSEGWESAPVVIDDASAGRALPDTVLGAAWVDGDLQVIFHRWNDESAAERWSVLAFSGASTPHVTPFLAEDALCPPTSICSASMALEREGRWELVLETDGGLVELARDGTRRPSDWRVANASMMADQVDNTATGVLSYPLLGSYVLGPGGDLLQAPAPAAGLEVTTAWRYFETRAGLLSRRSLTAVLDGGVPGAPRGILVPGFLTAQWLGARAVALQAPESDDDLRAIDVTDVAHPSGHVVARAPSFSCGDLQTGTFLPREGGHWLVGSSGCYVALQDDLSRADPIDLLTHLRRRGSVGIDWDERSHEWMLAWIFFGLPLSLLAALALSALRARRAGGVPGPLPSRLAWGAGAYVISAGWMLLGIAPLFR